MLMDVEKHAVTIPVAGPLIQSLPDLRRYYDEWFALPAEERKRRSEEAAERARAERLAVRERDGITVPAADLVDVVEKSMGWPSGYLDHLAQPYCDCGPDRDDGWFFCGHAQDAFPEAC